MPLSTDGGSAASTQPRLRVGRRRQATRSVPSEDFFAALEQIGIDYAIKISVNEKTARRAADLVSEEFVQDGDEIVEEAEGTYRRGIWNRQRPVAVVRPRLT